MTCLYRADTRRLDVVQVRCPRGTTYPATDADGETIYENTHFKTEAEAWGKLMREVSAGVSLAGSRVQDARRRLLDANQYAADQAVEYETARGRYKEWRRVQAPVPEPTDEECDE